MTTPGALPTLRRWCDWLLARLTTHTMSEREWEMNAIYDGEDGPDD